MSIAHYYRSVVTIISKLKIDHTPKLGRWNLKHSEEICERYIKNYYGEPGYPNEFKIRWIYSLEKYSKSSINKNTKA